MNVRRLKSGSYNYRMMKDGIQISFTSKKQLTSKKEIAERFQLALSKKQGSGEAISTLNKTPVLLDITSAGNTGFVYFISNGHGAVKVGKAHNVKERLRSLQTSSPHRLEVIKVLEYQGECAILGEKFWHRIMRKRFRPMSGEWFEAETDAVLKTISEYQGLEDEHA